MPRLSLRGVCCLLLCWICSTAFSMTCKWLQPGQELLSKSILLNFQKLSEMFPIECRTSTFPPNIDFIYNTTQAEDAVLPLFEVTHQINKFYSNAGQLLGYNTTSLEPFQASLDQMTNNLRDCENAFNATIQWETWKAIHNYFRTLEQIRTEKDNHLCARHVIQVEVGKQLQLTVQLTTRIRRTDILNTLSSS